MNEEIFYQLQERLDQYSIGFPKTESGIEIRILKKLFTEADVEMFLNLTTVLEKPKTIAERVSAPLEETTEHLEEMAKKGLIFRLRKGSRIMFAASPFVVGLYEYQLSRFDKELAELVETYFNEGFLSKSISGSIVPLRTVPINHCLDSTWQIAPYQDAREIVKAKKRIALAECICRQQQQLIGKGCGKPMENCFVFDSHADYYVENGMARLITQEEAMAILDECEKEGLVNQLGSTVNPAGMCNCCGDCCGILRALNLHPKPSEMVLNNYRVKVNRDECSSCETCLDRCQVNAIGLDNEGLVTVNYDRCIGCGLCVTECPEECLEMELKPEEMQTEPFATNKDLAQAIAQKRGISPIKPKR